MSTKFYLHDATTTDTGTLPGSTTLSTQKATPDVTASGAATNRVANTTIGLAQVAPTLATLAQTAGQFNWFRRFVSDPINAVTIGGVAASNYTFASARATSNATNSAYNELGSIYVWRPSTGAIVGAVIDGISGTLPILQVISAPATETWGTGTGVGTAATVTALNGDILVFEVWGQIGQAMATSYTWTIYYDGTTEGSSTTAASYILMPENITFVGAAQAPARRAISKQQAVNRAASW